MKAICRKSNNTVVDCQKQTMLIILSWDAADSLQDYLISFTCYLTTRVEHRDIKNICEKDTVKTVLEAALK